MNQLKKIIHYNQLISKNLNKNQFILSKDKTTPLSFIEITPNQYRFVFDDYDKHMKLNQNMKNLLFVINEESKNKAVFSAEPFERGYATTIGNSLRRILLTSIPGAAITSIKIDGVQHEFSNIKGVLEDVSQIIQNLKKHK